MIEYINTGGEDGKVDKLSISGSIFDMASDLLYAIRCTYGMIAKSNQDDADTFMAIVRTIVNSDKIMPRDYDTDCAVVVRRETEEEEENG